MQLTRVFMLITIGANTLREGIHVCGTQENRYTRTY